MHNGIVFCKNRSTNDFPAENWTQLMHKIMPNSCRKNHFKFALGKSRGLFMTYFVKSSTLKKTYSPDETIFNSSAAKRMSRTLRGEAHRTTTEIYKQKIKFHSFL